MPTRQKRTRGSSRLWPDRCDAGAASVEMVLLAAFLFLFTFAVVQGGLWFHARSVALGAAQEGARVAAAESSSEGAGAAAAADFVADAGSGVLLGATTSGTRTATTATVVVTGHSQSILFFWDPTIVQTASVPVERITG